jgi:hypothetical protein
LIIGAIVYLVSGINRTAQQALAPFEESNQRLQTQIAQVLNPTPTILPDPVTVIHEIRSLSRLETIQYSVEKVITAEIAQEQLGFLFGDRLLLVAHGKVIAGVDLNKLTDQDFQIKGRVLNVRLPKAEVFVATLENDRSYVYDRDTGLLRREDKNLETQARQAAENEIMKAALEDGILNQAQVNAEKTLESLLNKLGFDQVVFLRE